MRPAHPQLSTGRGARRARIRYERDCDICILPWDPSAEPESAGLSAEASLEYTFRRYMAEHLFICVKLDHELAARESVCMDDINGYNFLLRSELGFWDALCREHMPSSRFLVQKDEFEFQELIRNSSLPCFATDYIMNGAPGYAGRICIPITDDYVNVTFYIGVKKGLNFNMPL